MKVEISIKLLRLWNSDASLCTCRGLRRTCAEFWWQQVDKIQRQCTANDGVQSAASLHRCEPKHIHRETLACLQFGVVLIVLRCFRDAVCQKLHRCVWIYQSSSCVQNIAGVFFLIAVYYRHPTKGRKIQDHIRPYNTTGYWMKPDVMLEIVCRHLVSCPPFSSCRNKHRSK